MFIRTHMHAGGLTRDNGQGNSDFTQGHLSVILSLMLGTLRKVFAISTKMIRLKSYCMRWIAEG